MLRIVVSADTQMPRLNLIWQFKETTMNSRSTHGGRRVRSGLALLAMASTVLLLSPAAQAQRMQGSGGSQSGGRAATAHQFNRAAANFSGFRGSGFAARGGRFHGGFGRVVVIGGVGFWYPYPYGYPYPYPYYAYPYAYDSSAATPAYNMPPPAPTWFYCEAAGAYYPYVATCPGGWREVPATPSQGYPVPQQ
jgi:hypothetical protein